MIGVLCLTYGRTKHLAEQVQSFLLQNNKNDCMLYIINDNTNQKISIAHKNIHVENLHRRCKTLGDKRSIANEICKDEIRISIDDDDIILPWFVESMLLFEFMHGFGLASPYFFSSRSVDCSIKYQKLQGVPIYTKKTYNDVGGYASVDTGQDQELNSRIKKLKTYKENNKIAPPAYIYQWGNGVQHFSGKADGNEWERARIHCEKRMDSGEEPTGDIIIDPYWEIDYVEKCRPIVEKWCLDNNWPNPIRPWADDRKPNFRTAKKQSFPTPLEDGWVRYTAPNGKTVIIPSNMSKTRNCNIVMP